MATQIKLRRDTDANWTTNSTVVLAQGEIGVNLTNGQFKLGNGTSTWAQLTYFQPGAPEAASINNFGEGFSLTSANKIVTNKLYSTNLTQPNQHYRLEVDTNGVVVLPDSSIINGATLKTIAGNYAGITAGPASPAGRDEDSWVWVDNDGATISTKTSTDNHQWKFDNTGNLTLPAGGDIVDSNGDSVLGGGEGLPTITVPAATGTDYKGLQVSYGSFYGNPQSSTRSVNKVVIHKPAITTTTISDDSNDDFFQVSGVGTSDVLAMFVFFSDINGEKPVSDIQAFAEEVIDLVILDEGVEGDYNTVDEMKTAFYANYADLATALNGLATDFLFFDDVLALNGGVTTVRQGSGATFNITNNGDGTYTVGGGGGANYLPGHKIKILASELEAGVTPENDIIITVTEVISGGIIDEITHTGTAAGTSVATDNGVTGTNYNVGSGFTVTNIGKYTGYVNYNTYGTNYVVGDVITLLGANLTNGTTPENNITITVVQVDGGGQPFDYTSSGTIPDVWKANSIGDGGSDEYDTGNYIDSSYDTQIDYNGGATVANGVAAFGTGSSYSFVYQASIFGLFVTGNSSTRIGTSGGGGDSGSVAVAGNIYGPNTAEQIFDNAVTHINIVSDPYAGPLIMFTRTDYGDEIDEISDGLHITKDDQGWLYNDLEDDGHGSNTPTGSRWNNDGWDDFSDVESRTYTSLENIWGGNFQNIPGAKMIMLDETTDKYWAIEFLSWTNGNQGGGASYTRQELDLTNLATGIRFPDGTRLTSAAGVGRVKLRGSYGRRIEEVSGYDQVTVTERITAAEVTSTAALGNELALGNVTIVVSSPQQTALNAIVNSGAFYDFEVSSDETNWFSANYGGSGTTGGNLYFQLNLRNGVTLPVAQGATVYYRITTGGDPAVWWDKDDLPGGGADFRGAIIDYHAYTGDGTWIGTIHIVDDDGEENITHTEVSSGGTDMENDDLWLVENEGTISYRRIDGESATLRIQWTAKVFYGSEFYD